MRIFYVAPRSAWVEKSIYPALTELGHEVIRYDWGSAWPAAGDKNWLERVKPRINEEMCSRVAKAHSKKPIDLFFSYLYSTVAFPDTVDAIKRLGILTVNFSCNNVDQFHLVEEIAPHYDYCMVPERIALEKYRRVGARPIYIQLAANPHVCQPYPLPREYSVTFVGQRYGDRADYVLFLLENGIDVKVWGPGWGGKTGLNRTTLKAALSVVEDDGVSTAFKIFGNRAIRAVRQALRHLTPQADNRPIADPALIRREDLLSQAAGLRLGYLDFVKMHSRSKISLGFNTVSGFSADGRPLKQIHVREFEGPMSGAFYLTEYQEELEDFYTIGEEVACYHSREDLLDKVCYYLAHPQEAESIRHRGCDRARRDHTWVRRFEDLFRAIGLS